MDWVRSSWHYAACTRDKEREEWRHSDSLPTTDACLHSLQELMTFRHYKWDITASNLPAPLVVIYKKAEAILMVGLLPFWEFRPETAAHQIAPSQPKIRFESLNPQLLVKLHMILTP